MLIVTTIYNFLYGWNGYLAIPPINLYWTFRSIWRLHKWQIQNLKTNKIIQDYKRFHELISIIQEIYKTIYIITYVTHKYLNTKRRSTRGTIQAGQIYNVQNIWTINQNTCLSTKLSKSCHYPTCKTIHHNTTKILR